MSQVITNEHGDQAQVATNMGWSNFCDWAATLDTSQYTEIKHLAQHGWERDLHDLADELEEALQTHPPPESVTHTVQAIIDFIHKHDSEVAMISNGVEADQSW
jgi:hypothetical protein